MSPRSPRGSSGSCYPVSPYVAAQQPCLRKNALSGALSPRSSAAHQQQQQQQRQPGGLAATAQGALAAQTRAPMQPKVAHGRVSAVEAARRNAEVQKVRTLREVSKAVLAVQRLSQSSSHSQRGATPEVVPEDSELAQGQSAKLASARAAHKAQMRSTDRSQHFALSMMHKIDRMCDGLLPGSMDAGESSPSVCCSTEYGSFSPGGFASPAPSTGYGSPAPWDFSSPLPSREYSLGSPRDTLSPPLLP